MAGVTISGNSGAFAQAATPAIVQVKRAWSDDWSTMPGLEMEQAIACSAGHGTDSAIFTQRFGLIKHPWESAAGQVLPVDLSHWWVRVLLCDDSGTHPVWTGRIRDPVRTIYGAVDVPTGEQTWQAYGPVQMLERIPVGRSYWNREDILSCVAWVPAANRGTANGAVFGNRATDKMDAHRAGREAYVFGGTSTWTRYDLLEYLLEWFANEDDDGPLWTLTGQTEPLQDIADVVDWSRVRSVADAIRLIVPIQYGIDWTVDATEDGFAVRVFSLLRSSRSWGGITIPANTLPVSVDTGRTLDNISTRLVASGCHQYRKIRVLGERIVVCCTLWGPGWAGIQDHAGSLAGVWPAAYEDDYEDAGNQTDPGIGETETKADKIDKYRDQTKFLHVWSYFCAPTDWDMHDGACAPFFDLEGNWDSTKTADYQLSIRETLSWLPLWENYDYSVDPAEDETSGLCEPSLLRPMLFIALLPEPERMVLAEKLGIGVSVATQDWGIYAPANPRHRAAYRHYSAASPRGNESPATEWDWEWYAATIAFQSDQRLTLEYEAEESAADGILEIEVQGAECWFLAPNTLVGADDEGGPVNSGLDGRVLRNDREKLALVMAGAIARYLQPRARAEIVARRLLPWGGLVGGLLDHVNDGTDLHALRCPITQIVWRAKEQTTTILAGHAQ